MKQHLLKKLSMLFVMLCLTVNGFSQTCVASYSSANNGGGSYTFTNTGSNSFLITSDWYVNYSYVGSGSNFSYSFPGNGSYNVCLMISDSTNSCWDSMCGVITVSGMAAGTGCHAAFTTSLNGSSASFAIQTNLPNFNPNAVTHITWSLGDGAGYGPGAASYPSSFTALSHIYNNPGTYAVCLTLYDSINMCSDTYCDSVVIAGAPANGTGCHADFNVNATGNNNENLYTISYANPQFDSSYVSYVTWDFGDGSTSSGTLFNGNGPYAGAVTHTYAASGMYTVCLTLTDSVHSCVDTFCNSVWVGNVTPTCNANFVLWEDSTNAGTWYAYSYSNSFNNSTTYLWDFGDGTTSTQQYPSHTYTTAGHYDICLTVTDSLISCTSTYCDTSSAHRYSSAAGMMNLTVLAPGSTTGISTHEESLTSVSVYPNPVTENATLSITSEENTTVSYSVYNMYGQMVNCAKAAINKGKNTLSLNTAELSNGIYFVRVIDNHNKKITTIRIVK
ncbi:MAG: PKD domain-containing protein [Bacteroidia bacterium]